MKKLISTIGVGLLAFSAIFVSALTISPSFDNAVQYIKTIFATDNGDDTGILGVKIDGTKSEIWSDKYCDLSGANCINPVDITTGNTLQTLSLVSNMISISSGNGVSLASYLDNTDSQILSLSGAELSISNGNSVTLPSAQTLSFVEGMLQISDGNTINISSVNTDEQLLALSGTELSISNGNSITLPSTTDTDNQILSLSGTSIFITNGNNIDLVGIFVDTTLTEAEVDAYVANNGYLTGEIDRSTTNEIQSLIISGNDLSISSGNSINLSFLSSTLWQQSGSDIYYTSGNVGIGVSNPQYTLDIVGTINQTTTLSDGRTTNIQAGENVAGLGVKGVGFTTITGNILDYIFAGDSSATGGEPHFAGIGILDTTTFQSQAAFNVSSSGGVYTTIMRNIENNNISQIQAQNGSIQFYVSSGSDANMQLLPSALRIDAGMILIDYVSSRDDTTTIAPENFLYTDNGGNLLSAPLTAIVNSSNQTLSLSGNELSISSGNSITLPSTTAMSISGATDTIITSLTTGAILYYDGDKWRNLPVGTISQKLIVGDNGLLTWVDDNLESEYATITLGSDYTVNIGNVTNWYLDTAYPKNGNIVTDGTTISGFTPGVTYEVRADIRFTASAAGYGYYKFITTTSGISTSSSNATVYSTNYNANAASSITPTYTFTAGTGTTLVLNVPITGYGRYSQGSQLLIKSISGELPVNIANLTDSDSQVLSFSGDLLVISNGNSVDLSPYKQTLSFSGTLLQISNGNTIDLNDQAVTKVAGFYNADEVVAIDNIEIKYTANKWQIRTTDGSSFVGETNTSYDYSSLLTQGLYDSFLGRNKTTNGTFSDLNAGGTLSQSTQTASKVEIVFTDRTNERMWKYTMIVSPSGSKNAMTIERLY